MKIFGGLKTISMAAFAAMLLSCSDSNEEQVTPVPSTDPDTTVVEEAKTHTVIFYLMGNETGLEEDMDKNIQRVVTTAMTNALVDDSCHIAIFYDRGNYTRLTKIAKDTDGRTKQLVLKEYNINASCVEPEFISSVIDEVKTALPADSYGLVVSSHGGGWVPSATYDDHVATRFMGQDGDEWLEIPQLVEGLKGTTFDYILFDACFMASVEALYDLRETAKYIIASPTEVLGTGFPYATILPLLFEQGHKLEDVCAAFMEEYKNSSGTISLTDCSKLDALATAMKDVLAANGGTTVDLSKIQGYEGYDPHLYFDLLQYVEQLTGSTGTAYEKFKTALGNAVIYEGHTDTFISAFGPSKGTISLPRSCGLSCHVNDTTRPETHAAFLNTDWAKAVGAK